MTVFAYKAVGADGRQQAGTLPAASRAAAISQLSASGLLPVEVNESGSHAVRIAVPTQRLTGGRVSQKHVESFTRELSTLLAGGVPLSRALHLLRREASSPAAGRLWEQVHDDVVGGMSLADALGQHPAAFSTIYVAMVRAGEAGGFLDVVLAQIADFRTREQDLKGKVLAALIYPCVLGVLATVVLVLLLTFFIPRFASIFADFGAALPALTRLILFMSGLVTSYGIFVAGGVLAAVLLFKRAITTETGRRRLERTILKLPLVGRVVSHFALVRFCRMLGTLLGAGVPLIAALRVAKEAIGNQTLADTVADGIEAVQRGASLARSLGSASLMFPASVMEMIAIAEETGRLDKELVRLSIVYESELDRRLRMLVALAEPLLLVGMAGLIGMVVLGMLLPIFNLQDLIK
jgi:type II secretory pathway component PulF